MYIFQHSRVLQIFYHSARESRCLFSSTTCQTDTKPVELPDDDSRVVKVAIVGPPNAGKSTFINNLVGRRVCAISSKVHTTRRQLRAITAEGNTQIIFLDTPGLVTAEELRKHKLSRTFIADPELALEQADVIGVVHDVANHWTRDILDLKSLRLLRLHQDKRSILILNKIDALKSKRKLLDLAKHLTNNSLKSPNSARDVEKKDSLSELSVREMMKRETSWSHFSEIFMVSALTGSGIGDVKEYLLQIAPRSPWLFKDSQFTDIPEEDMILQAVQARLLEHLPQEVPYNLNVVMEYLDKAPEGSITAVVLVKCKTDRIGKLLIGARGVRIKTIAREAEQDLQNTYLETVRLKVMVTSPNKEK